MSQIAKQWLGSKEKIFTIDKRDGGIVGSLIGLGYVEKHVMSTPSGPIWRGEYKITPSGIEWTKRQAR